jgi:hypothetical protein
MGRPHRKNVHRVPQFSSTGFYRGRYFEITRGSALECAAIPGVLVVSGGMDDAVNRQGKRQLNRIVSTLTKLVQRAQSVETDIRETDEPNRCYRHWHPQPLVFGSAIHVENDE